ncbi:MAG: CDP-glycerol glycerophosphotransferase family protein [Candidatus Spechtbacteria bacterium]|nr:CDP-glycerol glycerophosphotransferase family protein [Candidatus Spechtbacteria bacterium]
MDTKICLYAHDWNYIDNYSPFIAWLESQHIDYEIIFLKQNISEHDCALLSHYGEMHGKKFVAVFEEFHRKTYIRFFCKIPIFGLALKTIFAIRYLASFFQKKSYSHLIVSDDRMYEACALIAAAKQKIPTIILYPVEGLQTLEGALLPKLQEAETLSRSFVKTIAFSLAKILYPSNVMRIQNRDVYFIPPRQVLELYLLHIFPKNPWIRGTNPIDLVAVNSNMQMEENVKLGMNSVKMRVTGFPPHDSLHSLIQERSERKQKLCEILGIDSSKKIFLIVGTSYSDDFHPRQFSALDSQVNQVLALLLETLRDEFYFVFKTHPRMEPKTQIETFQKERGAMLTFISADWTMYELVGIADVILNFVSASTDASLATDAPILSYRLEGRTVFETETKRYASVIPVYTMAQLEEIALDLKKSAMLDPQMKKSRDEDRKKFGMFDGKNTERFVALLSVRPSPHKNVS